MKRVNKIRLLFTIFFFLLFVNFSFSQIPPKNDIEEMNLKGKVKSLKTNTYEVIKIKGEIHKGKIIVDYESSQYFLFDIEGNILEKSSYKYELDGSIDKYSYKYDDNGNKTEENQYFYNDTTEWKLSKKHIYKYDNKGNLIEEGDYFSGSINSNITNKFTYKYDDKGNMIEQCYTHGYFKEIYTYVYDDKGNMIEENLYNYSGSDDKVYSTKQIYKYDNQGNKIEEQFFQNKKVIYKSILKYDVNDNMIESISRDSDGILVGEEYNKYDNNGNLIEEKSNSPTMYGGVESKIIYTYNDKGNVIEKIKSSSMRNQKKEDKIKFEYDKNNNWIKTIFFDRNKPFGMIERIIEYYE